MADNHEMRVIEGEIQFSKKSYRSPFKVHCMVLNSSNDIIAIGSKAGDIVLRRISWKQIWKMNVSQIGLFGKSLEKAGQLECIEFSSTGELLAAGMNNGFIHIIDVETGFHKQSVRVEGDQMTPTITKIRFCLDTNEEMSLTGWEKLIHDIGVDVEYEKIKAKPSKGKSPLYDTTAEFLREKPDVAREDIAFVFQMLEEDSLLIRGEDGLEEHLENRFVCNRKFRSHYRGAILLAIRDDFVVSILIGGIFPIAHIDMNRVCENLELSPVLLYDAYYSRSIGGITVAMTSCGQKPKLDNEEKNFGVPIGKSENAVHTHLFNFKFQINYQMWDLAMRYLRLNYGFILLNTSFETSQRNWENQIQILTNRFDPHTTSVNIGDLLIDMFLSGASDVSGETVLDRGIGIDGLNGIKEFCDKHLTELGRVVRGQLITGTRNMVFQINEFVALSKSILHDEHIHQNAADILTKTKEEFPNLLGYEPENEIIFELEKVAAQLEIKVRQFAFSCSIMLQELSHLVKWMTLLKQFARGAKPAAWIRTKRLDAKKLMEYLLKMFVLDETVKEKYENYMFHLKNVMEKMKEEEDAEMFDELAFFEEARIDAEKMHKEYQKELRRLRPEVMEYSRNRGGDGNGEANTSTDSMNVDDGKKEELRKIDLDRIGSYFQDELSPRALEIVPDCNDFLIGIEDDQREGSALKLNGDAKKIGLKRIMKNLESIINKSPLVLEQIFNVSKKEKNLSMQWMYEIESDVKHQGYQKLELFGTINETLGKRKKLTNTNLLRRAIHVCALTKTTFLSDFINPRLTEEQTNNGEAEGPILNLRKKYNTQMINYISLRETVPEPTVTTQPEIVRENSWNVPREVPRERSRVDSDSDSNSNTESESESEEEEMMEVDENALGLRVNVEDNYLQPSKFTRMISFEAVYPLFNDELFLLAKFETADGFGGSTKRMIKLVSYNENTDGPWLVQNECWGTNEVIEWAAFCGNVSKGAYVHDDGSRVAVFSLIKERIPNPDDRYRRFMIDPPAMTFFQFREYEARRDRLRKMNPPNHSLFPAPIKLNKIVDELMDERRNNRTSR